MEYFGRTGLADPLSDRAMTLTLEQFEFAHFRPSARNAGAAVPVTTHGWAGDGCASALVAAGSARRGRK